MSSAPFNMSLCCTLLSCFSADLDGQGQSQNRSPQGRVKVIVEEKLQSERQWQRLEKIRVQSEREKQRQTCKKWVLPNREKCRLLLWLEDCKSRLLYTAIENGSEILNDLCKLFRKLLRHEFLDLQRRHLEAAKGSIKCVCHSALSNVTQAFLFFIFYFLQEPKW